MSSSSEHSDAHPAIDAEVDRLISVVATAAKLGDRRQILLSGLATPRFEALTQLQHPVRGLHQALMARQSLGIF
jgi:hypothetical protein